MSFSPCQTFGSTPGPAASKMTAPWLAGRDYSDGMGLTVDLPASEEPPSYKQPEPHLQVTPSAQYLLLYPLEAESTSFSRNFWQGSRTCRWSITSRPGMSGYKRGGSQVPGAAAGSWFP